MKLNKNGQPRKQNKIRVDRGLPRGKTSVLALLKCMKPGESFYTEKLDKDVTAQASYQGIKVLTKRCIVIENIHSPLPLLEHVTKVTIL